jgi:hypothetical protein
MVRISEFGQTSMTTALACFLGMWAKVLAWSQVAERFGVSWYKVAYAVQYLAIMAWKIGIYQVLQPWGLMR